MKKMVVVFVLVVLLLMPFTAFAGTKGPGGNSIIPTEQSGNSGS